ncbi:UDP-N-acetylglucosamine--N-acetylmuramyl-(pentapeptide) pyrophosphoryl-undecaprenol N-acetylglucosamine transferase [Aquimarina aggregata]|uniref:UDP-N-acetylglucosamine--N-acetylmuramyl-(pentapeptide) pyrophosphoryl-undecaprenol N-acetylglucosamine transferase n=1 Tax=Aquimarina aggregata TaxID=1642818 RepID=A0A162YCT1_9FLAO|nr:undecaprenyldiphospho-muramoylpentapeptide beta-N-acetylglucosaminyltransferase [Aquimarina aggregata]KZS39053.1 UDP-N-acetylglucosamine--N-acetylmuramyl-(pentapeptide) pyrophosphoryl-undecaprenol N-acetylglucosamine transferase [Aquimarina aggregata]
MSKLKVILSGGGTGGHIYPAIAIANELSSRYPEVSILFVGAKDRMEMQKVPQAGYEIIGLWISGIQRKLTLSNLLFPIKLLSSLWKSKRVIKKFKPDVVIGTGGFASGPLLKVANAKSIPTLIQEQNSFPGITNKWLSKGADKICVAYDNMNRFFPEDKIVKTGNPVRQDLLTIEGKKEEGLLKYNLDAQKKTILVLGGSLGARRVNQLIEKELDFFQKNDVQVLWQCGKLYFEEYKKYNSQNQIQVHQFLDTMDLAYAAADVIISRAGASSVSELCIVGKPVLFIPSPNVAEDHQTKNAKAIVDQGGARMLKESELDEQFQDVLSEILVSKTIQEELSGKIKTLALPNATSDIVDEIEEILKK